MAYIYDLNAILVRAMPAKNDGAMIAAFTDILTTLNARGYAPASEIDSKVILMGHEIVKLL